MTLRFQHKLSIPAAAYPLVKRSAFLDQLDQAISGKQVVALAALAGWGKTTMLAQWAARTALPVAWYTLDSSDRDPQLFLDYLLHAISPCAPGLDDIAKQLASASPQALPELFRIVALAIAAVSEPFALILDDYHTVEDDSLPMLPGMELIFDLLARIAEYAPNCHLVLSSRMLPNLRGIARLIAQRRAVFFDYAMLQWTVDEVQQLALTGGSAIAPEQAEQLIARMNGWVTGIVLSLDQIRTESQLPLAESSGAYMAFAAQPSALVEADTTQVYAYFAEQIIAPLAPALQQFLEDTSVLDDLSPQRCNALREAHDAAAFLAEITRRGLFVSHKGATLAYHSLFRDFLRRRLAQDPVHERTLLQRAAHLYREEDNLDRALDCYLDAGAEDRALDLLRASIARFRQRSRQNTLLACFERFSAHLEHLGKGRMLPSDLLLAQVRVYNDLALWERAELAIQLAETIGDDAVRWEAAILYAEVLLLRGQYERAQAALSDVPSAALSPRLLFEYHRTNGRVQTLAGDITAAIASLEEAQLLTSSAVDTDDIPIQLATIADNLGWAYMTQGDRQMALRCLKRADACWQASGNIGRRAVTLYNLGELALDHGQYTEARAAFESGLEIANQTARRREEFHLHYGLGELNILEGQLGQAQQHFRDAYELAVRLDVPANVQAAAISLIWVQALRGDTEATHQWQLVAAAVGNSGRPELRGRRALAESLLLLGQQHPSMAQLASLIEEAAAAEYLYRPPERGYLALLQATLAFEQEGWAHAAARWEAFEALAADLPDALLRCFILPHRHIFRAAAPSSPVAQHLIKTTTIPSPIRWHITALGSFACFVDGNPCDLSPLHRALLVRLLDAGSAGLTVERLWEEVWGDSDIRMAALHKALARLREQTGLAMAARAGHCAIDSAWAAISYDVLAFERALAAAHSRQELERAVALYLGDFLPGAAPSAALWVDRRRSLLQQRYLDALDQLARLLEDEEPKQAIQHYQHILQIDGCREETAIQLMRLAARQRNHALVNATFEQLEGALRTLGAAPEPATIALLHASTRHSSLERPRPVPS